LPGSLARVRITVQKPVVRAAVHVLGKAPRVELLTRSTDGRSAEGAFEIQPGDTGYEIEVRDQYGFANPHRPPPSSSPASLLPPEVPFLAEKSAPPGDTGPPEDREVEGIPVAAGSRFLLEYTCSHRYGLSHAQLRYRILRGGAARDESGALDLSKFQP